MSIFKKLENNIGTLSSSLGKQLADKVLKGDTHILTEAVELASYRVEDEKAKDIRAGAAKIVEKTAEKAPELVAPFLEELFLALRVKEPQTRWMIMNAYGYCAHLAPHQAKVAVACAGKFIKNKEGLIIASSADLFLGYFGKISKENARIALPILAESAHTCIKNEEDSIIEALILTAENMEDSYVELFNKYVTEWEKSEKKATRDRVEKYKNAIKGRQD